MEEERFFWRKVWRRRGEVFVENSLEEEGSLGRRRGFWGEQFGGGGEFVEEERFLGRTVWRRME